ncbi:MAG: GTP-binding protein [Acidobacteriota bacterium]
MTQAHYIMVGGFLGAGKTTALLQLARHLTAQGRRVGLITNDQSHGLVDTTLVTAEGYPVREITGGCFCCRFNSLTEAAAGLAAEAAPDVFLAEPVGSCTDLRATVQYPLRRLYGDNYRVAPLTVLVDPVRALRILGLEPGRAFSPKVLYVYRTQLAEADLIVVNKMDLVDESRLARLQEALHAAFPRAVVLTASARSGVGLEPWFTRLLTDESADWPAPEVDYDVYAEGEALLGWLNATLRLEAAAPFDGNALLAELGSHVAAELADRQLEVAHFKMTLSPDEGGDLGLLNLVATDRTPEQPHLLQDDLRRGELIVNLRAEGDPDVLKSIVTGALDAVTNRPGLATRVVHIEHFRPSRPVPTHRVVTI